jgi:hypothetical protein
MVNAGSGSTSATATVTGASSGHWSSRVKVYRIRGDGSGYYLRKAMGYEGPVPLEIFNDACREYDQLKQVIVEARALASAEIAGQPLKQAA